VGTPVPHGFFGHLDDAELVAARFQKARPREKEKSEGQQQPERHQQGEPRFLFDKKQSGLDQKVGPEKSAIQVHH
jgi:hypothetical protein